MWRVLILLLATVVLLPDVTASSLSRIPRQAGRCPRGRSCTPVTECPELMKLLRPPTMEGIRTLNENNCGFSSRTPLVCCNHQQPPPPPPLTTPPTIRPVQPNPIVPPGSSTSVNPGRSGVSDGEDLLPRNCGHSPPNDKIHGGTPAALGAYPWMAILGYTRNRGSSVGVFWGCGGSLITNRYVLTAAHCTVREMTNRLYLTTVRLGENDLSTETDCRDSQCAPPAIDFGIENVVRHETFHKRGSLSDDLALLRLDNVVTFTAFVQAVCLPYAGERLESILGHNRSVVVSGWGDTESGRRSQQLLQVLLPFVPMDICRTKGGYARVLAQGEGQVCFGGNFQMDSCFKDSGGPAIVTRSIYGPPYVQLAVVSFGTKTCGVTDVPAIYSDVAHYRPWIVDNLKP